MNNDIFNMDLTRTLPPALKQDVTMWALSQVIAGELQENARLICNNVIYARIDELPEKLLDILAYDLHIDWYDYDYPVEVKKNLIKTSVKVHKKLGTVYAVETILGALHPRSEIEEWFDYGGRPFCFRIHLDGDYNFAINIVDILKKILIYKRLSAHLETICIEYHIKVLNDYRNAVQARIRFCPRQNLEYLYLDGRRRLDGSRRLDGYIADADFDLYPVCSTAKICVLAQTALNSDRSIARTAVSVDNSYIDFIRAKTRFFPRQNLEYLYLDGRRRLDGSLKLNGCIDNVNIDLYPICFSVKVCETIQNIMDISNSTANTVTKIDDSYINTSRIKMIATKKVQYQPGGAIASEVVATVCTQKAHVKIHGCLDGTKKLTGSRKLNAGQYKLT